MVATTARHECLNTVDKELLDQAIKRLAIRDVYFEKATAQTKDGFDPPSFTEPLAVQFKVGVIDTRRSTAADDGTGIVRVVSECAMRLVASSDSGDLSDQDEKALISATLVAEYQVLGELEPDALQEFSEQNGLFHAWPFWREYVHSACARLRLPPIPVPMYKLPVTASTDATPHESESARVDAIEQPPTRNRAKRQKGGQV